MTTTKRKTKKKTKGKKKVKNVIKKIVSKLKKRGGITEATETPVEAATAIPAEPVRLNVFDLEEGGVYTAFEKQDDGSFTELERKFAVVKGRLKNAYFGKDEILAASRFHTVCSYVPISARFEKIAQLDTSSIPNDPGLGVSVTKFEDGKKYVTRNDNTVYWRLGEEVYNKHGQVHMLRLGFQFDEYLERPLKTEAPSENTQASGAI